MYFSTVYEWLNWIASLHRMEIDLNLERVLSVAARLDVLKPACPIITIGGTNGKGSTVAGLEAIYLAGGYQVGAFTSPILFEHNDYVRINGVNAQDADFCNAYAQVEALRLGTLLTAFEFYTLGALLIFKHYPLDVILLEVGLGGRLDSVNIIDADLAIVTNISLDHMDRLGCTREAIGFEKAGIFRNQQLAICGDPNPPQTLINHAKAIATQIYYQGQDFHYHLNDETWTWQSLNTIYTDLPYNALAVENMSVVLMAISLMQKKLPILTQAILKGLKNLSLPGRVQVLPGNPEKIFDVAHNPASVTLLSNHLRKKPKTGKTYAVFSMLGDKDILTSINRMRDCIDEWFIAPLITPRAASEVVLLNAFTKAKIKPVLNFRNIKDAYLAAENKAHSSDTIIIFGSFHTVAEVLPMMKQRK